MKKLILILSTVCAGLLVSCSQNLLEVEQKGVLDTELTYAEADDADAEALIAPIYRNYWSGVYGLGMYIGLPSQDGDHYCGGGSYSDGGTTRYNYWWCTTPSTGNHISEYTNIYKVIYWSNLIVEKLNNEENSAVKNRVIAEAKYLRALSLMMGIQMFGTPPFVPTSDTTEPGNGDPAEMWAWIETNLNEAAAVLPSKSSLNGQSEIGGRATKEAAYAYLGMAQLLQKKYAEASETLVNKVVNSNLYALNEDFSLITKGAGDFSPENIFEYNSANDPTTYGTQNDLRCMYLHVRSSFIKLASNAWGTGWGFIPPSLDFVNFMKEHDAVDGGYSSRFNGTLMSYNDYQKLEGANGLAASPFIDNCGYIGLKYYFWLDDYIEGSGAGVPRNARYHKNWVFLRYAEVLLNIAEAEAQQGKTSGIGLTCLNQVRERAGLEPLATLSMEAVKKERRAELWGENGTRFFDLVRWGDAATVLKDAGKYRYEFYAPKNSTEVDADDNYPVFNSAEEGAASGRKTYIVKYIDPIYGSTAGFKSGKDEVWPFPESEILSDPNLTQNAGW